MITKQYNAFKTANKTATVNGLEKGTNTRYATCLFDFSLLNDMVLSDIEKQGIKNSALKSVSASNKTDFYGSLVDNFTAYDGIANYYCHPVYNTVGKHLYNIMELANVTHYSKSRKHSYDNNYDVITQTAKSGTNSPYSDIEVA